MHAPTVAEDAGPTPGDAHARVSADLPDAAGFATSRVYRRTMSAAVRTCRALAVSTGVVVLAACAGGSGSDDAAGSSAAASSSTAETTQAPDLASGLLTAEQFPVDATVVAVPLAQLRAGAGLSALGEDLEITPEACATAVQGTQPDLDAFDDVAGVSATWPTGVTLEMLLRGGPTTESLDLLAAAAERCPQAQISSPQIGTATVTFEEVPVPDVGDGAVALRFTTVVTAPDGTETTVPALVGAFQDGDRLAVLTTLSDPRTPDAPAPDAAAFAALLEQAYEVQADALG